VTAQPDGRGIAAPLIAREHLVASTAANLAGWHDAHARSLGRSTGWHAGVWRSPDPIPYIFFSAIAIRPQASPLEFATGTPADRWIAVCDPWNDVALGAHGFAFDGDHPWMVRPAEASAADGARTGTTYDPPMDLRIDGVASGAELVDFERCAAAGFGTPLPAPFTWHGPSLIEDRRLRMFRGRIGEETVSVAMAFLEAGVVGVYSVTTVASARGNGYASALTARACAEWPDFPIVLQPSAMAESLYRRLGFTRFTTFRSWTREAGRR
jgi:hypothetical protein